AVISIAAILNKHSQGELYFGIRNDGTVVGQQVSEKTIRDVSQAISEGIEPKIYPKIEKVNIENSNCILISFSGEKPPYFAFGRAYMRVGDEDRQLAISEIEKLILTKNKENMQWDKQVSECILDDIDVRAVKQFVKKANIAGRMDFGFQDVRITLTKLGMIKNEKVLRIAQVLFSSKNQVKVQAAVFAGTEKLTFLDIQQFEGQNIFQLLKTCEEYVKKHIMWRVKFGKLEREEIPEIPIDALREALINSLCHRDYYSPQTNYIAIYKDRIEIDNPGTFPENLEPEDYIFKNEPSVPRNPLIAEALYRTKDIERWGSGLKRIYEECKENDVKVEFKKMKTGFRIIFYRRIVKVPEKVTVKVPEK
ncbi:transcriptional regulator, partial [Candidatus Peregrinibacteria bacterium RIFOXYB2_FULL_32_7]